MYNQQFKGTLRSLSRLFSLTSDPIQNKNQTNLILKFDQPLYQTKTYFPFHDELEEITLDSTDLFINPLYSGWDENTRKFVLTNKLLPRSETHSILIDEQLKSKFSTSQTSKNISNRTKIKFTAWPLSQEITNQGKTKSDSVFSTLYVPESEFEGINDPAFETVSTLPLNWETIQRRSANAIGKTYENIFDYLAPQRGGFIWPGTKNTFFTKNK